MYLAHDSVTEVAGLIWEVLALGGLPGVSAVSCSAVSCSAVSCRFTGGSALGT